MSLPSSHIQKWTPVARLNLEAGDLGMSPWRKPKKQPSRDRAPSIHSLACLSLSIRPVSCLTSDHLPSLMTTLSAYFAGHIFQSLASSLPSSWLSVLTGRWLSFWPHAQILLFTSLWSLECLTQISHWVKLFAETRPLTFPSCVFSSSVSCCVSIPHPHCKLTGLTTTESLERDVQCPLYLMVHHSLLSGSSQFSRI